MKEEGWQLGVGFGDVGLGLVAPWIEAAVPDAVTATSLLGEIINKCQ